MTIAILAMQGAFLEHYEKASERTGHLRYIETED